MNHIGPLYCETPIGETISTFPIEFVNTFSNIPAILFGLFALWFVYFRAPKRYELYFLGFFLFATGVGSTLWHGLRTGWALMLDVVPGLLFFLFFIFCWVALLRNRLWGILAIPLFFLIQFLSVWLFSTFSLSISPFFILFGVVFLFGAILLYFTFRKYGKKPVVFASLTIIFALFAAMMRTLDLLVCSNIPFGTHLLWHLFLGLAGLAAIFVVYLLKSDLELPSRRQ